jgi:uncharacterized membrane protein YjgN (DUF898 family)
MSMDLNTPATGAAHDTHAIARFRGTGGEYGQLVLGGSLLSIITLGIYRFWFLTNVRRYLWSNTEIGQETLEYTGRGIELFLGFLIAIAVLIPVTILLAFPGLNAIASLIYLWLGQYAIYRARRYQLTRTVFRGVRFHQEGSAISYAFRAFGWWLLIFLTLGLVYPWAQASLERYKMRNTFYGDFPGRFAGTGTGLFARGIALWLIIVVPMIALAVASPHLAPALESLLRASRPGIELPQINLSQAASGFVVGAILLWGVLAAFLLFPAFEAITMRWSLSGWRFGDIAVTSSLRIVQLYGIWLLFLLVALVLGVVFAVIGTTFMSGFFSQVMLIGAPTEGTPELPPWPATAAIAVYYFAAVVTFGTLYQVMVRLPLWRKGVESLDVANFQMVELVKAEGKASSAFGEGFADALDVGVGL